MTSSNARPYDILACTERAPTAAEVFAPRPDDPLPSLVVNVPFPYATPPSRTKSTRADATAIGPQLQAIYQRRVSQPAQLPTNPYGYSNGSQSVYSKYSAEMTPRLKAPAEVRVSRYDRRVIVQEKHTL
ncbi:hypothetical protein SpCBS45565_g04066 [Spizellomyces sp. 'palustris']|nr:hypothetical protein SpCBS45565_g04066 [Spizellomyces sp. 'palustris']